MLKRFFFCNFVGDLLKYQTALIGDCGDLHNLHIYTSVFLYSSLDSFLNHDLLCRPWVYLTVMTNVWETLAIETLANCFSDEIFYFNEEVWKCLFVINFFKIVWFKEVNLKNLKELPNLELFNWLIFATLSSFDISSSWILSVLKLTGFF